MREFEWSKFSGPYYHQEPKWRMKNIQYCSFMIWASKKRAIIFVIILSFILLFAYFLFYDKATEIEVHVVYQDNLKRNVSTEKFDFAKGLTFQCGNGELGNRMFFYAVVYGLSRLNNRSGYVQKCNTNTCRFSQQDCKLDSLDQVFELSLPVGPDLPKEKQKGHDISFHLTFPKDYHISPAANILVGEFYPCSVTHFLHVREEIRREFRFRKPFQEYAQSFLKQARGVSQQNVTFVGIHVRRGSYISHLKSFSKKVVDQKFFNYSMTYFRKNVPNAMFIVLSDDLPWCQKNIVGNDVYIADKMGSAAQDLAVLSNCQHVIFDYGTYGLWGAFLAGGKAMYYVDGITDPTHSDPDLAKIMYPPEWTGVSESMLNINLNTE